MLSFMYVVFLSGSKSVQVFYLIHVFIYVLLLEIQLSRGEGWDPVIKRGGLGSSYQEGRVGIQLSRGEGWDPIYWYMYNPATFFVPVPSQVMDFERRMSCFISLCSVN